MQRPLMTIKRDGRNSATYLFEEERFLLQPCSQWRKMRDEALNVDLPCLATVEEEEDEDPLLSWRRRKKEEEA